MDTTFYPSNQPPLDQNFTTERFKGEVVVVAGGASGIGFATVHRFWNDGAEVAILDCNNKLGNAAVEYFKQKGSGDRIKFYPVDVSSLQQCNDVIKKVAIDYQGKINHLVNTVVYFGSKGIDARQEDWQNTFNVNVVGYSNMVQAVLPYMLKSGIACSIVNMCSVAECRAQPNRWTYSASKGAIKSLSKCMALDLSKHGIRVNSVSPAWIWSPEQAKVSPDGTRMSMRKTVEKFSMLKRDGETSEVASVVSFLCSKDASFITGVNIRVDGGYCAMGPEQHGDTSKFAGASYIVQADAETTIDNN